MADHAFIYCIISYGIQGSISGESLIHLYMPCYHVHSILDVYIIYDLCYVKDVKHYNHLNLLFVYCNCQKQFPRIVMQKQ